MNYGDPNTGERALRSIGNQKLHNSGPMDGYNRGQGEPPEKKRCLQPDRANTYPAGPANLVTLGLIFPVSRVQPLQQQIGLSTFSEIARLDSAVQDSVGDAKARKVLHSLNTSMFRPIHVQADTGVGDRAEAAASKAPVEVSCHELPYDWSLKKMLRFTSSHAFKSADSAIRPSVGSVARAQTACLEGHTNGLSDEDKLHASLLSWSFHEKLHAGLLSWSFPCDHWPSSTISSLLTLPSKASTSASATNPSSLPTIMSARLSAWRFALRNLYHSMRQGHCHSFYYITPEGTRYPYVILFCAKGTRGGGNSPHAVVSQTTKLFRGKLSAAGGTMLGDDDSNSEEMMQAAPSTNPIQGPPPVRDNTPQSVLLLQGGRAVHTLFDMILNDTNFEQTTNEPTDLPTLLAPVPFEGASQYKPLLRVRGQVKAASTGLRRQSSGGGILSMPLVDAASNASGSGSAHGVEVSGHVPCWSVYRLCHAFRDGQQSGTLSVALEAEQCSISLNCDVASTQGKGANGMLQRAMAHAVQPKGVTSQQELAAMKGANSSVLQRQQLQQGPRVQLNIICTAVHRALGSSSISSSQAVQQGLGPGSIFLPQLSTGP
eukprot:gene14468-20487_t